MKAAPELLAQNPVVEAADILTWESGIQLNKNKEENKSANDTAVNLKMNVPSVTEECGDTMWEKVLA